MKESHGNCLTRDIKEFNIIFLIVAGIVLVGIAGVSSFALFSGENSSSGKIVGTVVKGKVSGAQTVIDKVGTGGLVVESHPATTQLGATTTYRYTGANPSNYVRFNNESWRIIGVFDVDDGTGNVEQRIKIIRSNVLETVAWDSNGLNDWSKSSRMTVLNSGDYWNRTGTYASTGLTNEAKSMIDNAKWYLGGSSMANMKTSQYYTYERGTTVYSGNPTSWIGKVALMYPSDYGYATSGGSTTNRDGCLAKVLSQWGDSSVSDCRNNDWLRYSSGPQWTLTIGTTYDSNVFQVISTGKLSIGNAGNSQAIKPSVYLSFDILITGGTGTSTDPYILSK